MKVCRCGVVAQNAKGPENADLLVLLGLLGRSFRRSPPALFDFKKLQGANNGLAIWAGRVAHMVLTGTYIAACSQEDHCDLIGDPLRPKVLPTFRFSCCAF